MVDRNPDYAGPEQWAYQDEHGFYRAGPRSNMPDNKSIPKAQYQAIHGSINWRNRVKGIQNNPDIEADSYHEAQSWLKEMTDLEDKRDTAKREGNEELANELQKQIDNKREKAGS